MYGAAWYQEVLSAGTPRISPGGMTPSNYWNIFLTGIFPAEALGFVDWMGHEYRLPTAQEWKQAVTELAKYRASSSYLDMLNVPAAAGQQESTSERALAVCRQLEKMAAQSISQLTGTEGRRLCDQMLMRLGVIEYVYADTQLKSFAGWGQPNRQLYPSMRNPVRDSRPATLVKDCEKTRIRHFGFRLVRDKA